MGGLGKKQKSAESKVEVNKPELIPPELINKEKFFLFHNMQ